MTKPKYTLNTRITGPLYVTIKSIGERQTIGSTRTLLECAGAAYAEVTGQTPFDDTFELVSFAPRKGTAAFRLKKGVPIAD